MTTAREKFKTLNSLACLLMALEQQWTTVELRNENTVFGKVETVDAYMNITMSAVIFKPPYGKEKKFKDFFIRGPQIRFVHIPDEIDITSAIAGKVYHQTSRKMASGNVSSPKKEKKRKQSTVTITTESGIAAD